MHWKHDEMFALYFSSSMLYVAVALLLVQYVRVVGRLGEILIE